MWPAIQFPTVIGNAFGQGAEVQTVGSDAVQVLGRVFPKMVASPAEDGQGSAENMSVIDHLNDRNKLIKSFSIHRVRFGVRQGTLKQKTSKGEGDLSFVFRRNSVWETLHSGVMQMFDNVSVLEMVWVLRRIIARCQCAHENRVPRGCNRCFEVGDK